MLEALCAEPAITAFLGQAPRVRATVCSLAADLYVGHARIGAILYRPKDIGTFDKQIELEANGTGPAELAADYARQLGVVCESLRPAVRTTDMDRLRLARFALKQLQRPLLVIQLPQGITDVSPWDLLAENIEERLGGAIFMSLQKYPALIHGKNLTGRLVPREMAALLAQADGWIGLMAEAAALGWAAGRPGIVFTNERFDDPDGSIRVCPPVTEPEALLEAVCGMLETNEGSTQ